MLRGGARSEMITWNAVSTHREARTSLLIKNGAYGDIDAFSPPQERRENLWRNRGGKLNQRWLPSFGPTKPSEPASVMIDALSSSGRTELLIRDTPQQLSGRASAAAAACWL